LTVTDFCSGVVAVIVASPSASGVTKPSASTFNTSGLSTRYFTAWVTSRFWPEE